MTWDEIKADMKLDVGIIWVCRACPVQGRWEHVAIDAARHDAAAHAIWWHRDSLALTDIVLRLISQEEKELRLKVDWPSNEKQAVALMPPMEPLHEGELSTLQQELVCQAIGCPEDSRHRRRRRAQAQAATVPLLPV